MRFLQPDDKYVTAEHSRSTELDNISYCLKTQPYIFATHLQFCGDDRILDLSFALVQYSFISTKLQMSDKYKAFVF